MLQTNYRNLKKTLFFRNKGYWRMSALSILDKEINKGKWHFKSLRNNLSIQAQKNKKNLLQVTNYKKISHEKTGKTVKNKNYSNKFFSLTQVLRNDYGLDTAVEHGFLPGFFINQSEALLYNQINLLPFNIKSVRTRTNTEKYYNIQKIKEEFEKNLKEKRRIKSSKPYFNNKEYNKENKIKEYRESECEFYDYSYSANRKTRDKKIIQKENLINKKSNFDSISKIKDMYLMGETTLNPTATTQNQKLKKHNYSSFYKKNKISLPFKN